MGFSLSVRTGWLVAGAKAVWITSHLEISTRRGENATG